MKKRKWIIAAIVAVIALCTILPAIASLEKEKNLSFSIGGKTENIQRPIGSM